MKEGILLEALASIRDTARAGLGSSTPADWLNSLARIAGAAYFYANDGQGPVPRGTVKAPQSPSSPVMSRHEC